MEVGHGIVSGVNWSVEGGIFTIFGKRGWVRSRRWVLPAEILGGTQATVDPCPIKEKIEKIITDDIRNGDGDKIAYVGVGPFQGLLLALEGVITIEALQNAQETPDRIIMEAQLGDKPRTLVVLKDATYTMATYDRNDEVV